MTHLVRSVRESVGRCARFCRWAVLAVVLLSVRASAQRDSLVFARGDSVSVRLVDVDIRAAVQAMARYLDRPVIFSGTAGGRVTLETPRPIPSSDMPRLLRGLLAGQNLDLAVDSANGTYQVRSREAPRSTSTPIALTAGPQSRQSELYVIHLRHAKAAEVAATVNALYGRAAAFGELGDRSLPTLSRELTQLQAPPPGMPPPPQAVASVAGRVAALAGETTIVPDTRGNSLLVRASAPDFALIQAAVTELDVRPLQVLIEVLIAEVRRDRNLDFGIDATLPQSGVRGHPGTTVQATNISEGLGDFVIKVMSMGNLKIDATIRAAAARGDVNILSRPVLLAANNERAEINVGSQRPFVQIARVLPTDNSARDQVIQYKDVGTKLQIVPTISADGYVMLQVAQEINAATAEQQYNAPVISTRSVETRLLVKDGQTIVLGGLIDRQKEVTQSGIPFLSGLPWIGGFFGRASRHSAETELFLFLTPRVIRRDEDVESTTRSYEERSRRISP
jgi:general secretion pathway protein D